MRIVVFLSLIILSFVVENYYTKSVTLSKSPRLKVLVRILKLRLVKFFIKLLYLNRIFVNTFDNFWKYFNLFNLQNKYTKIKNISHTLYFKELQSFLLLKTSSSITKSIASSSAVRISLINLPIFSKTINSILVYQFIQFSQLYMPYFSLYLVNQTYFAILPGLKLYTNLNFYYFKVYEH